MASQIRDAVRIGKVDDASATIKVFKTRDYKKFSLAKENRPIYPRHVEKMKKSLEEHGFLLDTPIHVIEEKETGRLLITDGQHRFTAAKELGLDVYYIVKRDKDYRTDIQVMHTFLKNWKAEDYVHHFVTRGFPDYVALSDFCKRHKIAVSSATALLNLITGSVRGDSLTLWDLKTGNMKLKKDTITQGDEFLGRINDIRFMHERFKYFASDKRFLIALGYMIAHPDYDHKRMIAALSRQIVALIRCGSADQYLEVLSGIYNHSKREENRIVFKRGTSGRQ